MSGARVCSSPDLLPLSTRNHDDLSLEGIATNVKLLLKLVQDHQDASHKGIIDERKSQRFAGMMTILDDVKTRLQKSQTSGKKSKAELRRCNTDLKINMPPRDDTKKGVELILDEKERLRRDLNTSFAAQKRLGAMCASLGREKEIISRELTRKVQELNEMEQLVSDLRAQNERLSDKIRAFVAEEKDNKRVINGTKQHFSSTCLNERNKELSDQLLTSLEGYKLMKRRLKETQKEKEDIQSIMEELEDEIEVGIQQIDTLKHHFSSGNLGENEGKIEENILALDLVFYKLKQTISTHI
ncbi:hypothetical protein RND81_06G088100 [Saponaria officinalis]|uniref:Uncharacterized protein n=1 Tax=Saponaria officinalis TaxID=3572 RepID=A0AAW1K8W0_SAPOF